MTRKSRKIVFMHRTVEKKKKNAHTSQTTTKRLLYKRWNIMRSFQIIRVLKKESKYNGFLSQ